MYINSSIKYAIELLRDGDCFNEHVNRFRNHDERPKNPSTNEEKGIGRYAKIEMKGKALLDYYKCLEAAFDQEIYVSIFKKKLESIPTYLKSFYFLIAFYDDFNNVLILNDTLKEPYRYTL